jgi:putative exporter of polyketide antibiotics
MRNYQTLTLIGSALSMIIAVGFYLFATGLSSMTESFNESGFVESDTLAQSRSTMAYVYVSVPLVIILEIVALVLVFVSYQASAGKNHRGITNYYFSCSIDCYKLVWDITICIIIAGRDNCGKIQTKRKRR